MKTKWSSAVFAALMGLSAIAAAQGGGPVETRLDASKVERTADGAERLAPAPSVRPGDVIQYTATYRNTGSAAVHELDATLPIPPNTELVAGSAKPAGARASVDGRAFAPPPLRRRVMRDGHAIEEDIPLREYRYLRWHVDTLGAGKSVSFDARVKVIQDEAAQQRASAHPGR
jgi:uncharacterized repeat protein (TIGR01451 family)